MATPIINPKILAAIVAVLALGAAVAFGVMAIWAIVEVWRATSTPVPNEAYTYVESALAGLVGGIVATAFGVSLPTAKLGGLSNLSTAGAVNRQWIGAAYVVIYLVVGAAAIITWIFHADLVSGVVKNLACIFVGMVIPIVAGYFAKSR